MSSPVARVLWICGAGHLGGAERVSLTLLDALRRRGQAIEAVTRVGSPVTAAAQALEVPVHAVHLRGPARILGVLPLRRLLATRAADVALVTTVDEWVTACLALPCRAGPHLVLVRHMGLPLSAGVRTLAGRRARAVIAVSEAVRRALLAAPGIPPSRVHVIPNPVRFPVRTAVPGACLRSATRATLGLHAPGYWVGFFGGDAPAKGLHDVLAAVGAANRSVGPTNLLVGSPQPGGALVMPAHLRDRVHRLTDPERMADALTAVDLVVGATHRSLGEALPATLMEAMALGTPVVAYATGGVPEVLGTDGGSGQLVASDDVTALAAAVGALLADPARRDQLAAAALQRARTQFDPEVAAAAYAALWGDFRIVDRRSDPV